LGPGARAMPQLRGPGRPRPNKPSIRTRLARKHMFGFDLAFMLNNKWRAASSVTS
jgi:hypothetical protein